MKTRLALSHSYLHSRFAWQIALAPGAHLPWRVVPGSVRQVQALSLLRMNLRRLLETAFQRMPFYHLLIVSFFMATLSACESQSKTITPQAPFSNPAGIIEGTATSTDVITTSTFAVITQSLTPFTCSEDWQSLPVIPKVTEAARNLYQQGLAQGNNSHTFSKIGDGEISTEWFLTAFDLGEEQYDLGDYRNLKPIIETFHGSFERRSVAAQRGFNTNLILDSSAGNPSLCNADESPLDCELRIYNPSIAIISLGTNQAHRPEEFEVGMRQIIHVLVSRKVLPILSTKGDNLEGDHHINHTIACLAQEYQIPLWNFWAAIQPLPNHGLQPDLEHLTYIGMNDFDDPTAMQSAWTVRNLTALQVLDAVWRTVK